MNKTKTIQIRVTEEEYNTLYYYTEKNHYSRMSDYIRTKIFTNDNNDRQTLKDCYAGLMQVKDELNCDPCDANNVIDQIKNINTIGEMLWKGIISK